MDLQTALDAPCTRRSVLRWTAVGIGTGASSGVLSACAAAAPVAAEAAEAIGPAVASWLGDLIVAIGGGVAADQINQVLDGTSSQHADYQGAAQSVQPAMQGAGLDMVYNTYGFENSTQTLLYGCAHQNSPCAGDRLVMCAANGEAVALESWAWRALPVFAAKAAGTGGDAQRIKMANYTAAELVLASASGSVDSTDPTGTDRWVMYPTKLGQIVYKLQTDASGSQRVTVSAIDLPQTLGGSISYTFGLSSDKNT